MTRKKERILIAKRFRKAGMSWADSHRIARKDIISEDVALLEWHRDNGSELELINSIDVKDVFGYFEGTRDTWKITTKKGKTIMLKTDIFGGFEVV